MSNIIYKLNCMYDKMYGINRFLIFFIPAALGIILFHTAVISRSIPMLIIGLSILMFMMLFRMTYFVKHILFKKKKQ